MNLFKTIKNIYTKERFESEATKQEIMGLFRWMAMDRNNLLVLRKINEFLLYLSPKSLLILLYFAIQGRNKAPYIVYVKKTKKPENGVLLAKIQNYFGWSNRELGLNKKHLEALNTKEWKQKFGVK